MGKMRKVVRVGMHSADQNHYPQSQQRRGYESNGQGQQGPSGTEDKESQRDAQYQQANVNNQAPSIPTSMPAQSPASTQQTFDAREKDALVNQAASLQTAQSQPPTSYAPLLSDEDVQQPASSFKECSMTPTPTSAFQTIAQEVQMAISTAETQVSKNAPEAVTGLGGVSSGVAKITQMSLKSTGIGASSFDLSGVGLATSSLRLHILEMSGATLPLFSALGPDVNRMAQTSSLQSSSTQATPSRPHLVHGRPGLGSGATVNLPSFITSEDTEIVKVLFTADATRSSIVAAPSSTAFTNSSTTLSSSRPFTSLEFVSSISNNKIVKAVDDGAASAASSLTVQVTSSSNFPMPTTSPPDDDQNTSVSPSPKFPPSQGSPIITDGTIPTTSLPSTMPSDIIDQTNASTVSTPTSNSESPFSSSFSSVSPPDSPSGGLNLIPTSSFISIEPTTVPINLDIPLSDNTTTFDTSATFSINTSPTTILVSQQLSQPPTGFPGSITVISSSSFLVIRPTTIPAPFQISVSGSTTTISDAPFIIILESTTIPIPTVQSPSGSDTSPVFTWPAASSTPSTSSMTSHKHKAGVWVGIAVGITAFFALILAAFLIYRRRRSRRMEIRPSSPDSQMMTQVSTGTGNGSGWLGAPGGREHRPRISRLEHWKRGTIPPIAARASRENLIEGDEARGVVAEEEGEKEEEGDEDEDEEEEEEREEEEDEDEEEEEREEEEDEKKVEEDKEEGSEARAGAGVKVNEDGVSPLSKAENEIRSMKAGASADEFVSPVSGDGNDILDDKEASSQHGIAH